jgi:protein-disulfide isomerase
LDGLIVAFAGLVWSYRPPTPPPADIATLAETKTRVVLSACLSVALAALIAGIVIMRDHPTSETLAQFATQWKDGKSIDIPKDAHDPIIGPREGSVVLDITVFSDFECPFCAAAAFQLDRFAKQHPEQVRIRFKHFPLNPSCNPAAPGGGHQHACERAFIAQCAAEQGKFEDFHNRLFRNQRETLDEKVFQKWSAELGLNYDELKNCADRPETRQKIKLSAMEGEALQIRGTPTIYANGKMFELPPTLTNLAMLFDAQDKSNNR